MSSPLVGRFRRPEQCVSEARRRHTLHTGDFFDKRTELIIRENTGACKHGMGQPAAKDYFAFESLLTLDPFWSWSKEDATPLAPLCIMLLNVWWVTREIEASAARIFHLTVDRVPTTASWLLPTLKRDPLRLARPAHIGAVVATRRHTQHALFTCASPISNSSQKLSDVTTSNLSVRILSSRSELVERC